MSEKSGKAQEVILEQLKKHSGDSSSAIAWRYLGGGFLDGKAVGTVTITPNQLIFALGVKARVSELYRLGKVSRRPNPRCLLSGTVGDGYFPTGAYGRYRSRAAVPVPVGRAEASKVVVPAVIGREAQALMDEIDEG